VIGGGFVGLEVAENLAHAGLEVSVIEFGDHVIGPLDRDISYDLHNYIRSKGIGLHLNSEASAITHNSVKINGGAEVPAEMVVISAGVRPATSFLADSGIALGSRGEILVNDYMETSAESVYAVGDAVSTRNIVSGKQSVVPLASPANKQGVIAADNICGLPHRYAGSQGTAIIKMFDMAVAVTGENERSLTTAGVRYSKSITYSSSRAGYYPGGQMMAVKVLFGKLDGRLLGAQICGGEGVDKRIDVIASAIRAGMSVTELQDLELAYAPPFSSAKDPVNMAGYAAGNILSGKSDPVYVEEIDGFAGTLIDVRTPGEYGRGAIAGAVNIPLDDIRGRLGEIDSGAPVCVYCRVGQRGYVAERILKQKGYDVVNLIGGYRLYSARSNDERMHKKSAHA
jgi:rhodanese-related sulfurtransferase